MDVVVSSIEESQTIIVATGTESRETSPALAPVGILIIGLDHSLKSFLQRDCFPLVALKAGDVMLTWTTPLLMSFFVK